VNCEVKACAALQLAMLAQAFVIKSPGKIMLA
jgi:hypothetical protein